MLNVFPASLRKVDAAAVAAAVEIVRLQLDLPRAGDDDVRILLRHLQARATGVLIDEQHVLPGLAAVFAAEHAAFLLRTGGAAERADEHEVFVRRMDDDRADAAGVGKSHLRPRLAGVGRLVDAVAHHVHVADRPGFTGAGPHDIRIAWRDRERTDRLRGLVVERRLPRQPAVGGFPHATGRRARVIDAGLAGDTGRRRDPSRILRTGVLEARRANRLRRLRSRRRAAAALRRHGDRQKTKSGEKGSAHAQASPSPGSFGHRVPQGLWGFMGRTCIIAGRASATTDARYLLRWSETIGMNLRISRPGDRRDLEL